MPRKSFNGYLLVASLLLLPFARDKWRPIVFALLFAAVLWVQMAFTKGAGTGAHHTILLWPAPQFLIAAALDEVARRLRRGGTPLIVAIVTLACMANLALTSTYYTNMIRNGGSVGSTEASWPAADAIKAAHPRELCVLDWGFFEVIRLLHKGRTRLCAIGGTESEYDRKHVRLKLQDAGIFFIAHTEGNEFQQGSLKRFLNFALEQGYMPSDVRIFNDLNGRPLIQTFRVQPK
jgi:hypothetical protein